MQFGGKPFGWQFDYIAMLLGNHLKCILKKRGYYPPASSLKQRGDRFEEKMKMPKDPMVFWRESFLSNIQYTKENVINSLLMVDVSNGSWCLW